MNRWQSQSYSGERATITSQRLEVRDGYLHFQIEGKLPIETAVRSQSSDVLGEVRRGEDKESAASQKILLRIPEAAELLSISRTKLYQLIQRQEFPVVRIGRSARIPMVELQQGVREQSEGGDGWG